MSLNRHMKRAARAVGLSKAESVERTAEQIRQEYGQACATAGEIQYKIGEFKAQLDQVNDTIRKLNLEYSKNTQQMAPVSVPQQDQESQK